MDSVEVSGASDAGIYVGQSRDITVRNSIAKYNVAGIEIENSRNALVENNMALHNTGGILVFDLPDLPVMGGGEVLLRHNLVAANDTPNFAPPGNIVAGVLRGTGIMVMANEKVLVADNVLADNATAHVMVVTYTLPFEDERYNPYPREVVIAENIYHGGGDDPQFEGAPALLAAFGGALPPVLWDGLADGDRPALLAAEGTRGWSLNLPRQGASPAEAQPGPLSVSAASASLLHSGVGAPEELGARLK